MGQPKTHLSCTYLKHRGEVITGKRHLEVFGIKTGVKIIWKSSIEQQESSTLCCQSQALDTENCSGESVRVAEGGMHQAKSGKEL